MKDAWRVFQYGNSKNQMKLIERAGMVIVWLFFGLSEIFQNED